MEAMNVTLRWESALPVQQALLRQGAGAGESKSKPGASEDESKAGADANQKYYVIAVFGFRMPGRRDRQSASSGGNPDDDQDRGSRSNDDLRSQLLDAAQLIPKGHRAIYADDVQVTGFGSDEVRFLFPRTAPIVAGDKEVDFILEVHGIKLEHKFHLSEMQYQGKLAL